MTTVHRARDIQPSAAHLGNGPIRDSDEGYRRLVEGLPAAIYTCDLEGRVLFYNRTAAVLWGREPQIGVELWCGSWRIYRPDGTPLALDKCPMATALREGRAVEGEEIVIERPDGTRRHVVAHPQPIYDDGEIVGAVNMLLDVTEFHRAERALRDSEERFRTVAMNAPAAIFVKDLAGRYTLANPLACQALGRPEGVAGLTDHDLLPREVADLLHQHDAEVIESGKSVEYEEVVERDGFVADYLSVKFPLFDAEGHAVGVCGVSTDITARKRAENTCRESEERFARFMQHLPGLAWIKDEAGRYVFANESASKAFQTKLADLYGKTDAELFPPETAVQFWENDLRALAGEQGIQTVETLADSDGIVRHSLVNKFPIPDSSGVPTWIGGMAIDITERQRAEETQALLAAIVESSNDAIMTITLDGTINSWNAAAQRIFDYSADEIVGQTVMTLIPSDRHKEEEEILGKLRRGERVEHYETIRLGKAGRLIDVSLTVSPVRDAAGRIVGASKVVRDVTLRKQAEQLLRASEERFRTLASLAPVGIFMSAANGENVLVNQCWCELAGLTPEQARGTGWIQALHPDDRERIIAGWNDATQNGNASSADYRFLRSDGEVIWLQGNAVPLHQVDGEVAGYIGTVIDVTKRKQAEDSLREADRRKNEFLAILAHELRNPLAPIRTGLELMRIAGDDAALIEEVRATMERQTQQMARLIDDLLDVSRITRGTMELRKSRVELASVVQHAVEAARPIIEEQGHRLAIELPKQPLLLDADPTRLAQVISNLLNNAAKYMEAGGEVRLEAERRGANVVIRVIDRGIGIPAEMLDRIFDMFTQVDRSIERSHGGLGIGLTLVKQLVDMHGGTVEAHSAGTGQGSEFAVTLPLWTDAKLDSTPTGGENFAATGRRRVLVVDDNESAARILSLLLKALGSEVRTVHDGLAAIDVAAEFRPDLVLMDIGMPKLNGYDTARRIREQPWGKQMVLAALTGWGQEEDKARTREAGFDHHFVKPIDSEIIRRLLAD